MEGELGTAGTPCFCHCLSKLFVLTDMLSNTGERVMESVSFWRLPDSQQTCPRDPFRWNPSAVPEPHPAQEDHGGPREEEGNYRGSVR